MQLSVGTRRVPSRLRRMRIHMVVYMLFDFRFRRESPPAIRHRTTKRSVALVRSRVLIQNRLLSTKIFCNTKIFIVFDATYLKSFPHCAHLYGFSPVWMRRCWFKIVRCLKFRPQYTHPYGFSFVCILKCCVKWLCCLNLISNTIKLFK